MKDNTRSSDASLLSFLELMDRLVDANIAEKSNRSTIVEGILNIIPEVSSVASGVIYRDHCIVDVTQGPGSQSLAHVSFPWSLTSGEHSYLFGDLGFQLGARQGSGLLPLGEILSDHHFRAGLIFSVEPKVGVVFFFRTHDGAEISAHGKEILRQCCNALLRHQRLLRSELRLSDAYQELEQQSAKLRYMFTLTAHLGNSKLSLEQYLQFLLSTAMKVVGNAGAGSISLIKGDNWRFIATQGHDLQKLQAIPLRKEHMYRSEKVQLVRNLSEINKLSMDPAVYEAFRSSSLAVRESLVVNLPVGGGDLVNLSLDVLQDARRGFGPNAERVFDSFAKLAQGFVSLRMYTETIRNAYQGFTQRLALLAEIHDRDSAAHNGRVAGIAAALGEAMGLEPAKVEEIRLFAGLHDIGKLFIDRELLQRNGPLTKNEIAQVRRHTELAGELLQGDPMFETARNIAMYHHERYDGSGYPFGLLGDQIPREAQLVSVADVYDALRSERSYKPAMDSDEVLARMVQGDERNGPGSFDPKILETLCSMAPWIEERFYYLTPQLADTTL